MLPRYQKDKSRIAHMVLHPKSKREGSAVAVKLQKLWKKTPETLPHLTQASERSRVPA